jgi:dihydroxy-acid dehydratase
MTGRARLSPQELRSHQWYDTEGQLRTWSHNARMRQLGY